jgi:hypothetical protein
MKDLTISAIDRQNILNNNIVSETIQAYLGISGLLFQGEYRFTRLQVMEFFKLAMQ